MGAFQHSHRKYITIEVKDSNENPYTICDVNDTLYEKIQKVFVKI